MCMRNRRSSSVSSPELAIFSTGHKEHGKELCTGHYLHVHCISFAAWSGVRSSCWLTLWVCWSPQSHLLLTVLVLASFLSSFLWFVKEITDWEESMATINLRLRVFSTFTTIGPEISQHWPIGKRKYGRYCWCPPPQPLSWPEFIYCLRDISFLSLNTCISFALPESLFWCCSNLLASEGRPRNVCGGGNNTQDNPWAIEHLNQ